MLAYLSVCLHNKYDCTLHSERYICLCNLSVYLMDASSRILEVLSKWVQKCNASRALFIVRTPRVTTKFLHHF